MKLTTEQVRHIATLARLEITDTEAEHYREQLSAILDYVDQLQQVDTTGVEETSQVTGLVNAMRDDVVVPSGIESELIDTAPSHADGFITIPKVFSDTE